MVQVKFVKYPPILNGTYKKDTPSKDIGYQKWEVRKTYEVDMLYEITAKTNDEGFETVFDSYLKLSGLNQKDTLMVFSVGGGNLKKKVSVNLIKAIKYAKKKRSKVISIIGRKDGFAYKNSNAAILVNVNNKKFITPVTETFQVLVWHLLVTHPTLQINKTKW